jgi:hypothetical protein
MEVLQNTGMQHSIPWHAAQHTYSPIHPPTHRYLFTEFEDPEFGGRASAVHGAMLGGLDGAGPAGKAVCNAIRKQTEVMSQLAYISKELKVRRMRQGLLLWTHCNC